MPFKIYAELSKDKSALKFSYTLLNRQRVDYKVVDQCATDHSVRRFFELT